MRILLRSFVAMAILSATLLAQAPLEIVAAYWGDGNNFVDVTQNVRSLVRGGALETRVDSRALGLNPSRGNTNVLRVYYLQNGQFNQGEWQQNMMVRIGAGRDDRRDFGGNRRGRLLPLRIERAIYGAGNQVMDVTALLQSRVADNRLELPVTNETMGGDPAYGVVKQLQVTYDWAGQAFDVVANENDFLRLPDGVAPGGAAGGPPVRGQRLRIVKAQYGTLQGNRLADVTALLQRNMVGDRLSMQVNNNTMGVDPARGADKTLYIIYTLDNGPQLGKTIAEGQQFTLP